MEKIETIINKFPFFRGMDKAHLEKIAQVAAPVTLAPGKIICEDGQKADKFYLLMNGRVVVELYSPERGDLLIQTLNTGDILGWSWLVPPYQWRFNARVLAKTHAIVFNGERLRTLFGKNRELGYELQKRFLMIIAARLESASIQLMDLYGIPAGDKNK